MAADLLGDVPLFVTALKDTPLKRRTKIVVGECAIAFILLLVFMFFGLHFLEALQLSEVSLRIGGGVILLMIAIRMVFSYPDGVLGHSN